MNRPFRGLSLRAACAAIALSALFLPVRSQAASINYGNFPVPTTTVAFLDVTESSDTDPVPLFGPPTPFLTGLDFNPATFVAATAGGADITDGQLNFFVTNPQGIPTLAFQESGLYDLTGVGAAATQVYAGIGVVVRVLEIDGVPVSPINLPWASASVNYNLVANPGAGQSWAIAVNSAIGSYLWNDLGIAYDAGATKVQVILDNTLVSISESGSVASISKTDFKVVVPEPAAAVLALAGAVGLLAGRRRQC